MVRACRARGSASCAGAWRAELCKGSAGVDILRAVAAEQVGEALALIALYHEGVFIFEQGAAAELFGDGARELLQAVLTDAADAFDKGDSLSAAALVIATQRDAL